METNHSWNKSKIRDLEPSLWLDLRKAMFQSNLRNNGSLRLKLRRPSRSPAFCRSYIPGDPVNMIDWKIYARTDQLLIREENDDSSARVLILIDTADTMNWPPPHLKPTSIAKFEIGLRIGLNLGFIHYRMSDLCTIALWSREQEDPQRKLPVKSATDVVTFFDRIAAQGISMEEIQNNAIAFEMASRRFDTIYWISDYLGPSREAWINAHCKHAVIMHCLSSLERDLDWLSGDSCYFDQSNARREYLGNFLKGRAHYHETLNNWCTAIKKRLAKSGHDYLAFTDETSIRDYHADLLSTAIGS